MCAREACPRPAVEDERCHTAGRLKIRPQQRRFLLTPLLTCISIYRAPFRVLDYEWLCFPIWNSTKFAVRSVCEGYYSFASSQHRKRCRQVNFLWKSQSRGTEIRSFHSAMRLRLDSKFQRPIFDGHCAVAYIPASNFKIVSSYQIRGITYPYFSRFRQSKYEKHWNPLGGSILLHRS